MLPPQSEGGAVPGLSHAPSSHSSPGGLVLLVAVVVVEVVVEVDVDVEVVVVVLLLVVSWPQVKVSGCSGFHLPRGLQVMLPTSSSPHLDSSWLPAIAATLTIT